MIRKFMLILVFATSVAATVFGSSESQPRTGRFSIGIGLQSSYTKITISGDWPVGEKNRLRASLFLYYNFSDRVYNDIRYNSGAWGVEPFWIRDNIFPNRPWSFFWGIALPVGTVFIPNPPRAWDNLIFGFRLLSGLEFPLGARSRFYMEASIGVILHFVFDPGEPPDPYSTMIDGFSGFGITAGFRF
jgi:hypothetical protein